MRGLFLSLELFFSISCLSYEKIITMPFFRVLATAILLTTTATQAQQCYYPDGSPSNDIPCSNNAATSCCGSTSFCMDNGLCFGGGILSRGSCTDQKWKSQACSSYCQDVIPSSSVPLTPCSNNGGSTTFTCGLNGTACSDSSSVFSLSGGGTIVLRASQVEALVGPAISSLSAQTSTCISNSTVPAGFYTSTDMVGLGLGLGVPLLIAIIAAIYFFLKERRNAPPKLMYKLPDNHEEFLFQAPPKLNAGRNPSLRISPPSRSGSDAASMISSASTPPAHMQNFQDRYKMVAEKIGGVQRVVELPGSPIAHELGERKKLSSEVKRTPSSPLSPV